MRDSTRISGRAPWLAALVVVVAVAAGLSFSLTRPTLYRAEATILVTKGTAPATAADREAGRPLVRTLADLLDSSIVATGVVQSLRLPQTPETLRDRLHVSARSDSAVIDVGLDATTSDEAVRVLQQTGLLFSQRVQQRFDGSVGAAIFDPPHALPGRVSPRPVRDTLVAGAAGLVAAALLLAAAALLRPAPPAAEPDPEPEPEPDPEPAPAPAPVAPEEPETPRPVPAEELRGADGGFAVAALSMLVDGVAPRLAVDRLETLRTYLDVLRSEAGPEGTVPRDFDPLVHDVFGGLFAPAVDRFAAVHEQAPLEIWDGVLGRVVEGALATLGVIELDAGAIVPEHRHANEQLGVLVAGSLTFRIAEESRELRPGAMWAIPADVPHEVRVGPDGAVVVEVFTPRRDDWTRLSRREGAAPAWPA